MCRTIFMKLRCLKRTDWRRTLSMNSWTYNLNRRLCFTAIDLNVDMAALITFATREARSDNNIPRPTRSSELRMGSEGAAEAFTAATGFLSPSPETLFRLSASINPALLTHLTVVPDKEADAEEEEEEGRPKVKGGLAVRNINLAVAIVVRCCSTVKFRAFRKKRCWVGWSVGRPAGGVELINGSIYKHLQHSMSMNIEVQFCKKIPGILATG